MGREAWVYKGHSFIVPVNKKIKEHKFWNEWNFQYDPAFLSLAQKHELQPSGWYRQIPFLSIRLDLTFLNKDLADHRAYIIRLAVTERDSVGKSNDQGGEDRNVNKRELHGLLKSGGEEVLRPLTNFLWPTTKLSWLAPITSVPLASNNAAPTRKRL